MYFLIIFTILYNNFPGKRDEWLLTVFDPSLNFSSYILSKKYRESGRDVVEDFPRSGRPSTSSTEVNIAKVKEMVTGNCHLSLREIAIELSVSYESIRTILNDCLGMKRVATRLVP